MVERLMDIQNTLETKKMNMTIEYLTCWTTGTEPMIKITLSKKGKHVCNYLPYNKLLAAIDPNEMLYTYIKMLVRRLEEYNE